MGGTLVLENQHPLLKIPFRGLVYLVQFFLRNSCTFIVIHIYSVWEKYCILNFRLTVEFYLVSQEYVKCGSSSPSEPFN